MSARDARDGDSQMTVFAKDAAQIGHTRYLFAGRRYESPPAMGIMVSELEGKVLYALHIKGSIPIAVAIATSQACEANDFRLGNISEPI